MIFNSIMSPVIIRVESFLNKQGISYEKCDPGVFSTTKATEQIKAKCTPEYGTKAIVVHAKDRNGNEGYIIIALPCNKKIDIKKMKTETGYYDIVFATPEEIFFLTNGLKIGGIPPLGNMFGIKTVCDKSVFNREEIIFNVGRNNLFYIVPTKDYRAIILPLEVSIV